MLDRVGGGDDVEGARQRERLSLDAHLPLLHRLQQRGLGLGRGAVDLVGQQQAGEDRTLAEGELARAAVVDEAAGQVAGQQVGGELGAGELQADRLGQRPGGQGLAQTGQVLDQHVSTGEHGREHEFHLRAPSHECAVDCVEHPLGQPSRLGGRVHLGLGVVGHRSSILRVTALSWSELRRRRVVSSFHVWSPSSSGPRAKGVAGSAP